LAILWISMALAVLFLGSCKEIRPYLSYPTLVPTVTISPTPVKPTATATPTDTPTPTPTATPTPTSTPVPPVHLEIKLTKPVTALKPVTWRVLMEEPPGVDARLDASARVIDAQDQLYATFEMVPEGQGDWWVPVGTLQLPLEPEPYPGVWHLIIDAEADVPIEGYRDRVFTPQRVPYHVLTDTLPIGVQLHVPQAFPQVQMEGDQTAGLTAWGYEDCQITVAWAPGPTERLAYDVALVLAEAIQPTSDQQIEVKIENSEELAWGEDEQTAFLFRESWKSEGKSTPSETLVAQGPNYRLIALRIRAQNQDTLHPLCRDVRETLAFVEE
jgi:hypothetical protein